MALDAEGEPQRVAAGDRAVLAEAVGVLDLAQVACPARRWTASMNSSVVFLE